jgi:hypothetical protein
MRMTTKEIEREIAALLATPRALIASDEGTHGTPQNQRIYLEITGETYGVAQFAGSNWSRCSVESVYADTNGRVREFPAAKAEMAAKIARLRKLRESAAGAAANA